MEKAFRYLFGFVIFLSYRVNVKFHEPEWTDEGGYAQPNRVDMEWGHRPRWYSPTYWFWVLVLLASHIFKGGLAEWVSYVWNEFHESRWHSTGFTWKDGVSKWAKARAYFWIFYCA